jgi:hypothetical protein
MSSAACFEIDVELVDGVSGAGEHGNSIIRWPNRANEKDADPGGRISVQNAI